MSSNENFQINNLFNVQGKVALVTGGATGIGLMVRLTIMLSAYANSSAPKPLQ